ncbi:MAG TPA: type II secretion system protein N [Rudaea sp.]|nr:type II secretion system protein N [Rudaea sp.]
MKVVRAITLTVLALAAVAGVVAWTCPAELAYRFAADTLAPVRLHDLAGTLWHGHAGAADVFGMNLGSIDWNLQPTPLLRGEMLARLTLAGDLANGTGVVDRTGGTLWFRDVTLRLPARVAAPVLAIPALQLLGTLELDLAHARLSGLWLEDAAGTILWRNAAVAGAAQARLGDLQATFASTANGAIAGTAHDLGGPLELAGTFSASPGVYQAQARLAARAADPQVSEALQFVGQPQADGSRSLEIRGRQLDPFGT